MARTVELGPSVTKVGGGVYVLIYYDYQNFTLADNNFTFNNFGTETVFEMKDNKFFCFGCNKWFERMKGHLKMSRNCQKIVDVNNFLNAIEKIKQDRKRNK